MFDIRNIENKAMPQLAFDVVKIAWDMFKTNPPCEEKPKGSNTVYCANTKFNFYQGWQQGWAWCAGFVSYCYDKATLENLVENRLPVTAGTKTMLAGAKTNGLRVDNVPAIGSVGFRERDGGGHVFIVADIDKSGIMWTIEGNISDKVDIGFYPNNKYKISDHVFIHAEEMGNTPMRRIMGGGSQIITRNETSNPKQQTTQVVATSKNYYLR